MRDGDVLYVSNASAAEFGKVLNLLGLTATAAVGAGAASAVAR